MIDYKYKDLFNVEDNNLELVVNGTDIVIHNEDIFLESMGIRESLCSEETLRFGSCEAAEFKITIANKFDSLIGKTITVKSVLGTNTDEPFIWGTYKIVSDKITANKAHRELVGYDALYDILNADVTDWYNNLIFPMTIRTFRNSFFLHLGITQMGGSLINDEITIEKTIQTDMLKGADVIRAICEINGMFGTMGRDGVFKYIMLDKYKVNPTVIDGYRSGAFTYEDFVVPTIDKVQIRNSEGDIGVFSGTGDNLYTITDNFLVYGFNAEIMGIVADNVYTVINGVGYRPINVTYRGNPCLEIGDDIRVMYEETNYIDSYVLEREIVGIHSLSDSISAKGKEVYPEKNNDLISSVTQLTRRTNVLTRTVDATTSEIIRIDEEVGTLSTTVTQTAEAVKSKVSKNEIISEINQSAEEIKIQAEKIKLEGTVTANDNFKILQDGSIEANNANLSGKVNATEFKASTGAKITEDGTEITPYVELSALGIGFGAKDNSENVFPYSSSISYENFVFNKKNGNKYDEVIALYPKLNKAIFNTDAEINGLLKLGKLEKELVIKSATDNQTIKLSIDKIGAYDTFYYDYDSSSQKIVKKDYRQEFDGDVANLTDLNGIKFTGDVYADWINAEHLDLTDELRAKSVIASEMQTNTPDTNSDSVDVATTEFVKDLLAENIITYPYYRASGYTNNGVTYTVNDDGTISTTGTSGTSGNSQFQIAVNYLFKAGVTYTISGCPSGGSSSKYVLIVYKSGAYLARDYGNGATFTVEEDTTADVRILIQANQNMNGKVYKPMLEIGEKAHSYKPTPDSKATMRKEINDLKTALTGTQTLSLDDDM